MRFSWDFLQNMLENGHSNLQTNLWVHITSNIFKISNSKITGWHQPPRPPNFESLPYPGVGGRFGIFSLKWRERMNLKVPGAILPLGCVILRTVRGAVPPLGELGLIRWFKSSTFSCRLGCSRFTNIHMQRLWFSHRFVCVAKTKQIELFSWRFMLCYMNISGSFSCFIFSFFLLFVCLFVFV